LQRDEVTEKRQSPGYKITKKIKLNDIKIYAVTYEGTSAFYSRQYFIQY